MTETVNLGIKVESSQVTEAAEALERLTIAAGHAEKALKSLHGMAHGGVRIQIAGEIAQVDVFALEPEYTAANTVKVGKKIKAFLDGVEQKNVMAVDTRHGFVDLLVVGEEDIMQVDAAGKVITERKFGVVTVEIS